MANKLKMQLFVLTYSVVDASMFVLAKNEKDLFDRFSNHLICDDTYSVAYDSVPSEKRTDAAMSRAYKKLVREVIDAGVVGVRWQSGDEGMFHGKVRWSSYDVSDAEIAFLERIGLLEVETATAKAS
jgi:hypothetical protein